MCFFQFSLTFCPHKKQQNCYRQTRFRASKYTKNAFVVEALPRTLLGELTGKGKGWLTETAGLDPPLLQPASIAFPRRGDD